MRSSRLIIQLVMVEWEKSARGGQLAQMRAAVPKSMAIPPEALELRPGSYAFHVVAFGSKNDFSQPTFEKLTFRPTDETIQVECLEIAARHPLVRVAYQWSLLHGGLPADTQKDHTGTYSPVRRKAFDLELGAWGRVIYNGRFTDSDSGEWYYQQVVANIGFLENPRLDTFTAREPVAVFDRRRDLR